MSGFEAVGAFLEENYGVDGFVSLAKRMFDAGQRTKIFDEALAQLGFKVSEQMVDQLVAVFRNHSPEIHLRTAVRKMMTVLGSANRLALLTDGFPEAQRLKIKALEIEGLFDQIVVTGEHPTHWVKPGLAGFKYLQKLFGTASENCTYVGDNPIKDFEAPLYLGWHVVRIRPAQGVYRHITTPEGVPEFESIEAFHANARGSTRTAK